MTDADNAGRCPRVVTLGGHPSRDLKDYAEIDLDDYVPVQSLPRRCVFDIEHEGHCMIEMPNGGQMLVPPAT